MRIPCWISRATNKHSEYVILIAVPLQHWLNERTSVVRYTYVVWYKSNEAGKAVHEPTMLLPPPSHGS